MQKFIAKYALAAHLAVLAVAPLFLSHQWILWLSLAGAVWLLMEPSKIAGENLRSARKRVAVAVLKDPFFWLSLTVLSYQTLVMVNSGVALFYDAETSEWLMSDALMPLLPASADGFGAKESAGILALTVVVQGCRHALGKGARLAFFVTASFLSGISALVLTGGYFIGSETAAALVKCDMVDPRFAGPAFGMFSLAGNAALAAVFEKRWFKMLPFVWMGIAGSAAGLFLFSPPYAVALFASAHLILFLYSFAFAFKEMGAMAEFKYTVVFLMALSVSAVTVFFVLPEEMLAEKLAPWTSGSFISAEFTQARETLSQIAFSAWRKAPWTGTGLGTFPLDIKFHASDSAYAVISDAQTMPLNGYWKLLSETGITGSVLYLCLYSFLVFTFLRRAILGARAAFPSPLCLAGLLSFAAVVAEGFVDCSFLTPGSTVVLCSLMALSAASFPKGVK